MGQKSSKSSKAKVESQPAARVQPWLLTRRKKPLETNPLVLPNSVPEGADTNDQSRFQSTDHAFEGSRRYRPLDRSRNEIRLLRILPPTKSIDSSQSIELDPEIIRCQLEYASLDYIDQRSEVKLAEEAVGSVLLDFLFDGIPDSGTVDDARITVAMKQTLREHLSDTRTPKYSALDPFHPRRMELLREYFSQFDARHKEWLPPGFRTWTSSASWKSWLQSWIYTPLSGNESHPEDPTDGYLALSYVWADSYPLVYRNAEMNHITKLQQASGGSIAEMFAEIANSEYGVGTRLTSQIILDGNLVEVGQNLDKALKTLREIPEVKRGKRIWVDNLCINQEDSNEKSYEVKRMGRIYSSAERVVSWIGEEQNCSGEALEIMSMIGECLITEKEMVEFGQWFFGNLQSELVYRIAQVLCRPYWSRIWITQEIVSGNDKGITICGARRFPTSQLLTFGARISSSCPAVYLNQEFKLGSMSNAQTRDIPVYFLGSGIRKLRDLRATQVNLPELTKEPCTTCTLWFRTASGNFASDPRDLLYGMLNLLPKQLMAILPVDYSPQHTFRDVMVDFAEANMKSTDSLMWILHRPWSPFPGWQEWPSWVPNLALPFSTAHFHWELTSNCCSGIVDSVKFRVHSTSDTPALLCDGLLVDTINQATTSRASERSQQHRILMAAPHIADQIAHQSGIDPYTFRKVNRDIGGNTFPEPPPIPNLSIPFSRHHRYKDLVGLKDALAECFQRMNLAPRFPGESIFDVSLDHLENEDLNLSPMTIMTNPVMDPPTLFLLREVINLYGDLNLWGVSFRSLFPQRATEGKLPELVLKDRTLNLGRLFTTASGFVGASLCHLRAGDQIYIISGCPMPVALRPSARNPSAYELVGGVYVPGIMNGEIFQNLGRFESGYNKFDIICLI